MRYIKSAVLIAVIVSMGPAGSLSADTVTLHSGRTMEGKAKLSADTVIVETEGGTVTLARSRVASITRDNPGTIRVSESASTPEPADEPAPRKAADVLEQKLSVDFDDTPIQEAVRYLQDLVEAKFWVSQDLDAVDAPSVTLRLQDATLREVLDAITHSPGVDYAVDETGLIRIGATEEIREYDRRVYDVTDLLYDVSDRAVGGGRYGGGYGGYGGGGYGRRGGAGRAGVRNAGDRGGRGLVAAQYGSSGTWGRGSSYGGGRYGGGGYGGGGYGGGGYGGGGYGGGYY